MSASPKMAPSTDNCMWGDKDGSSPPLSHLSSSSSFIDKGVQHPLVCGTWELKNLVNLQCQPLCLFLGWWHPTSISTAASKPLVLCCSLGSLFQWGLGRKQTLKHTKNSGPTPTSCTAGRCCKIHSESFWFWNAASQGSTVATQKQLPPKAREKQNQTKA